MGNLAVASGWSPIGESIYTIVNKIQNLNALNQSDIKRVFLKPDDIRFSSKDLRKSSFNFERVLNSTGWTSDMLSLSFQDDFPCLDSSASINYYFRVSKIKRWHNNLRICSECFVHGVHLIFHQSPDWAKCPLHHIDLQPSCVSCGAELGAFEARYTRCGFCCNHCGYTPFSKPDDWASDTLKKAKINLSTNYQRWVTETNAKIRAAHHGIHNKEYIWATPTTEQDSLSSYYKLFGGPSWLGKCLSKHNKVVRHKLSVNYKITRPQKTTRATQIDNFHGSNYSYSDDYLRTDESFHDHLQTLRHENTAEIEQIFREAVEFVDRQIVRASSCLSSVHDFYDHNCIRNKYSQWEKGLRSLGYGSAGISFFWLSWLAGPGRDFRISIPTKDEYRRSKLNRNKAYTLECTRIWMRTKLLEAAKQHFSDKVDTASYSDLIIEEPKYLLKTDPTDSGLFLHEVRSDLSLKSIFKDYVCQ